MLTRKIVYKHLISVIHDIKNYPPRINNNKQIHGLLLNIHVICVKTSFKNTIPKR